MSQRMLAEALGCHHSSLRDCETFQAMVRISKGKVRRGFIDPRTRSLEANHVGRMEEAEDD